MVEPPTEHRDGAGSFHISTRDVDGAVVLSVHGDVDMLTAPKINEAVGAVAPGHPTTVIVDLSDVDFLSSAGMTALIAAQRQVGPSTRFLVVADGRGTSRPMKLMGIDEAVPLYPTVDEALTASQEE